MLDMKIVSTVVIEPITEAYLAELIKADIARQNKHVVVTSIVYEQRRSPNRVEVVVEAHLDTGEIPAMQTPATTSQAVDAGKAEVKEDKPAVTLEDPALGAEPEAAEEPKEPVTPAVASVADIFAGLPKIG